jgi:hypothetical protein
MYAFAVFLTHVKYSVDYDVLDLVTTKLAFSCMKIKILKCH